MLKKWALKFLDLLVVTLSLIVGLVILYINGAFISNIINSFRANQYIDAPVGVQVVLVSITMIWAPLFVLITLAKAPGR